MTKNTEIKSYSELRSGLVFYAEDDYREFIMRGIPSERPFIGVRVPQIREIVGRIPSALYEKFLGVQPVAFEEVLARGMIVTRLPYFKMLEYFDSQVNLIDDWCACDTFCSGITKIIKKHRAEFLELKIEKLLSDKREFAVRAGLVSLKCAYMDFDYLEMIFDRVENLKNRDEYYIRMAIAWLIAECFIKFPEMTLAYLKACDLPKWTFNKTISKICDSYRVEDEMKNILRKMRK